MWSSFSRALVLRVRSGWLSGAALRVALQLRSSKKSVTNRTKYTFVGVQSWKTAHLPTLEIQVKQKRAPTSPRLHLPPPSLSPKREWLSSLLKKKDSLGLVLSHITIFVVYSVFIKSWYVHD